MRKNKNHKGHFVLLMIMLISSSYLMAQQPTIRGRLFDQSNGAPVEGATIKLKNAKTTTQSAADGTFQFHAGPGKNVIIITSVGYRTVERTVTEGQDVQIGLETEVKVMEDVV